MPVSSAGIDFRRRISDQASDKESEHTPEVVASLISRGLAELARLPG